METIIKKIEYLRSLGFTEVTYISVEGYTTEYNYFDDNHNLYCSIYDNEFEVGDTLEDITYAATLYSCCGDILDKDLMICPTCKEHC